MNYRQLPPAGGWVPTVCESQPSESNTAIAFQKTWLCYSSAIEDGVLSRESFPFSPSLCVYLPASSTPCHWPRGQARSHGFPGAEWRGPPSARSVQGARGHFLVAVERARFSRSRRARSVVGEQRDRTRLISGSLRLSMAASAAPSSSLRGRDAS